MTIGLPARASQETLARRIAIWLCRLVSLAMFALGLFYWIRLIGVHDGALWRFDLMPLGWRIVAPALAVLYPIAGTGLWMGAPWGAVVWFILAAIEAMAVVYLTPVLGWERFVAAGLVGGLVVLVALNVVDRILLRRRLPQ